MICDFKAYAVPFKQDDNRIIDNMTGYLLALGGYNLGNATLMSHTFAMTLEIKVIGYDKFVNSGVNFIQITYAQDQQAYDQNQFILYYYFVSEVKRLDRNSDTALVRLSMDTLNTFAEDITWSDSTHILREHKDRFRWRPYQALWHPTARYEDIETLVDDYPENIPEMPKRMVYTRLVDDPVGGTANGWNIGYWTDLDGEGKPTGVPEIRLVPNGESFYDNTAPESDLQQFAPTLNVGDYYRILLTSTTPVTARRNGLSVTGKVIYMVFNRTSTAITWRIWAYNLTDNSNDGYFVYLSEIESNEPSDMTLTFELTKGATAHQVYDTNYTPQILVNGKGNYKTFQENGLRSLGDAYYTQRGLPTMPLWDSHYWTYGEFLDWLTDQVNYSTYAIGGTETTTKAPIEVNTPALRVDPKWIMWIETPYTPTNLMTYNGVAYSFKPPFVMESGKFPTLPVNWNFRYDSLSTLAIYGFGLDMRNAGLTDTTHFETDLKTRFRNADYNGVDEFSANAFINPYVELFDFVYGLPDPKILHSDFSDFEYRFDMTTLEIEFERFDSLWTFSTAWGGVRVPTITASMCISNEYSSSLAFVFDVSGCGMGEFQYKTDDPYALVLRSSRELAIPLYNSDYLNYMRYGYNYDKKSHEIDMAAGIFSSFLGAVSTIAGIATENPVAIVGGISAIAGGVGSLVAKDSAYKNEMAKKISQLTNKAMDVSNPVSLSVFKYYNGGNKIRQSLKIPMDYGIKMLNEFFFHFGYACDYHGIPNTYTRERFNYLRCEAEFSLDRVAADNIKTDMQQRFAQGVYYIHESTQSDIVNPLDKWAVMLENTSWGNTELEILRHI